MPIKTVPITAFKGMDNIREFAADMAAPKVILNAFVKSDGMIKKRKGYTKVVTLSDGHSLAAVSKYMLLADGTTLYSSDGVSLTSLGSIGVPILPLSFAEVNGIVYMGNASWNKVLDLSNNTLRDWGLPIPEQPVLSVTVGNLPVGRYSVCFTNSLAGRLSGNGQSADITLLTEGGIAVSNIPSGGVVWMTEPNGNQNFYAGVSSPIVAMPSQTDILPSLWCQPPLKMENISLGHGRIWGSVKGYLYYSMPFGYEWFRVASDFFYFPADIIMVAVVAGGIYVGMEKETIFLSGKKPDEMIPLRVGDGAIPGSLSFADNFGNYKNSSLSMLGNLDAGIPMWMSKFGIFAGMHNGTVIEITSRRIKYEAGKKAASLFHMVDGEPQYLASTQPGNVVGFGDSVTCEVIRNGRVFLGDFEDHSNDYVGFAEAVSADVT